MGNSKLFVEISKKGSDRAKIAEKIIKKPMFLLEFFDGLHNEKASIKYGCEKVLRIISEKKPNVYIHISINSLNFLIVKITFISGEQ
jgi:hypothetical protein